MSRSLRGGYRAINTDYSKCFMLRRFSLERNKAGQMVGECMDSNSCQAPEPLQCKAILAGYSRSSAWLPLFYIIVKAEACTHKHVHGGTEGCVKAKCLSSQEWQNLQDVVITELICYSKILASTCRFSVKFVRKWNRLFINDPSSYCEAGKVSILLCRCLKFVSMSWYRVSSDNMFSK